MLSINPINFYTKNYYLKQKNAYQNTNAQGYDTFVSFTASPKRVRKQTLLDLKNAIENKLSGIYKEKSENGTIKYELQQGNTVKSTDFNAKGRKISSSFFKDNKLIKIEKNIDAKNKAILKIKDNKLISFIHKDSKGRITFEQKNFFDDITGKQVSSTARNHAMKATTVSSYNYLGEVNATHVKYDSGISIDSLIENELPIEVVTKAPNGASITYKYTNEAEHPQTVVEQFNDYVHTEIYDGDKLTYSSTFNNKNVLTIETFDDEGFPVMGNFVTEDGSTYGIEFAEKGKMFSLFENLTGETVDTPESVINWFNEIGDCKYEIKKLRDAKPEIYPDENSMILIKTFYNDNLGKTDKRKTVFDKYHIPNEAFKPTEAELAKILSN